VCVQTSERLFIPPARSQMLQVAPTQKCISFPLICAATSIWSCKLGSTWLQFKNCQHHLEPWTKWTHFCSNSNFGSGLFSWLRLIQVIKWTETRISHARNYEVLKHLPLSVNGRRHSSGIWKSRQSERCTPNQKISGTAKTSASYAIVCIHHVISANFSNFSVYGYFSPIQDVYV
jgi:hypothetical protein